MRKEVKGSVLISALCFFQTAVNSYNCATWRKHPGQGRKEGGEEKSQELKQEVSKQDGLIRKKGAKL